jgi:pectate lyase
MTAIRFYSILSLVLGTTLVSTSLVSGQTVRRQMPAFPGAEGFGAMTPGGRGGKVLAVTNLNDKGPGSLREAVEAKGPRIIVFRVAGTIALNKPLQITEPYLTIAGQSAPGGGICLKNHALQIRDGAHDVVIRHLRVRPGLGGGDEPDGIVLSGEKGRPIRNVVLDHCSATWAVDENMDTWGGVEDCTIQWCIIAEGSMTGHHKGVHSMGLLCGPKDKTQRLSVHHNLFAHNNQRNPRFQGGLYEFVNNAVYNWGVTAGGLTEAPKANFIANFYKRGPSTKRDGIEIEVDGPAPLYLEGNIGPHRGMGILPMSEHGQDARATKEGATTADEWVITRTKGKPADQSLRRDKPWPPAPIPITVQKAADVLESILNGAGATLPQRDAVDRRIVNEVREGTGGLGIRSDYPVLDPGVALKDSDGDGMPDDWEKKSGFDPLDPSDGARDADGDGYTNVEEFLNSTDPRRADTLARQL